MLFGVDVLLHTNLEHLDTGHSGSVCWFGWGSKHFTPFPLKLARISKQRPFQLNRKKNKRRQLSLTETRSVSLLTNGQLTSALSQVLNNLSASDWCCSAVRSLLSLVPVLTVSEPHQGSLASGPHPNGRPECMWVVHTNPRGNKRCPL